MSKSVESLRPPGARLSGERPGDTVQAADIERRELLERSGREVDAAGRTASAAVRDEHGHGLAVGAGRGELLVADRVPKKRKRS